MALEQFKQAGDFSGPMFSALNSRAQDVLLNALSLVAPRSYSEQTNFSRILDGTLEQTIMIKAIDAAIDGLKSTKGPSPNFDIDLAVQLLCEVYEIATKAPPTFFLDPATGNMGSQSGLFIVKAMKQIDPTISNSRLATALRSRVEGKNSA